MRASPLSTEADSAGLTGHEAARLLAEVGPNTLPEPAVRSLPRLVATALTDPLVLVLLVAGVLTLATGDRPDTAVIALVVVINTVVTVRQNGHADDAVRALRTLQSPTCRVLRDGVEQALAAAALVPGDVVLLDEGDLVPADAVVLRAVALLVDESTVTGESVAVDKTAAGATAAGAGGTPGADATVLAGTAVVHGHGIVRVVATGTRSTLGQVAGLLQGPAQRTPLQRRMARLSLLIAAVAVLACSVVLLLGWWRGQDLELMVLTAVSLAVAAVPESLPAVVTITLSLAARRMAGRHAVVRDLAAAETLGSVTLLATDKTGTLTCAQMQVTRWWTAPGATEEQLRTAVRLCNDARLGEDGQHAGDPTEIALLVAARDADGDAVAEPVRVAEVPFDSVRKRMTTVHRVDGGHLVVVKGAPDHVLTAGVLRVSDATLAAAVSRSEGLSREGLRVLAVAQLSIGMLFGGTQTGATVVATDAGQPAAAGLIHATLGVGSAVAGIATAYLPERIGHERRALIAAGALLVLSLPLLAVDGIAHVTIAVLMLGFAVAPFMIANFTLGERTVPASSVGTAMTLLASATGVGYALGSSLAGRLADAHGSTAAFGVTVGATVLAVSVMATQQGRLRRAQADAGVVLV